MITAAGSIKVKYRPLSGRLGFFTIGGARQKHVSALIVAV